MTKSSYKIEKQGTTKLCELALGALFTFNGILYIKADELYKATVLGGHGRLGLIAYFSHDTLVTPAPAGFSVTIEV